MSDDGRERACFRVLSLSQTTDPPNRKLRRKDINNTYLPAEVAAVGVPVGVPAELVVHSHLWGGDWKIH